jgi:hypothetical protein
MPPLRKSSTRHSHQTDIELAQQIAELRGVTVEGFRGVNSHLATLNGRVGKHDELFGKILGDEKFQAGTKNGIGLAWKIFLALVTIALGILAIIATYNSGANYNPPLQSQVNISHLQ